MPLLISTRDRRIRLASRPEVQLLNPRAPSRKCMLQTEVDVGVLPAAAPVRRLGKDDGD